MKDQGALNSSWRSQRTSSSNLRGWRCCERQHPYRRTGTPNFVKPETTCVVTAVQATNGSPNGQTATLNNGKVNGKRQRESSQDPMLVDLMEQVAAGSIEPHLAASYIQQMMNTSQIISGIKLEDKAWGEANMPAEIVWAPGKSTSQLVVALQRVLQTGSSALAVRVSSQTAEEVLELIPEAKYNEVARALSLAPAKPKAPSRLPGTVAIITDASAEDQVVQEAVLALQFQGCYAYKLAGSGGPNSLPNLSAADSASVVIVVADGRQSLPGVIASSITPAVIVVPTDESKVANTPGLTHVDFNNGLAAALIAARILRTMAKMHVKR